MEEGFVYIAFGAGVQSTALVLLSDRENNDVPRADAAIFADTGNEPEQVYKTIEEIRKRISIPIHIVSDKRGNLGKVYLQRLQGQIRSAPSIPFWVAGKTGKATPLRRHCTRDFKIRPIERKVRELMGYRKGQRIPPQSAVGLLGISVDEADRMKPSRTPWVELQYPLIDMELTREDCFKITVEAGISVGRSSCVFCPYHGDRYWRQLAKEAPQDFLEACRFDQSLRAEGTGLGGGIDGVPFAHPSLQPLAERPFDQKLPEGMSNECEGYCGL